MLTASSLPTNIVNPQCPLDCTTFGSFAWNSTTHIIEPRFMQPKPDHTTYMTWDSFDDSSHGVITRMPCSHTYYLWHELESRVWGGGTSITAHVTLVTQLHSRSGWRCSRAFSEWQEQSMHLHEASAWAHECVRALRARCIRRTWPPSDPLP